MIVTEPVTAALSLAQSALPPEPSISERSQDILDEACSAKAQQSHVRWVEHRTFCCVPGTLCVSRVRQALWARA